MTHASTHFRPREVGSNQIVKAILLFVQAAGPVCTKARDMGLIVITAGPGDVVRMVPPLTITNEDVDIAIDILTKAFAEVLP